jgi:iron complex outermembrane receptor protein
MGAKFRLSGAALALAALLAKPASAQDVTQGNTVALPPIDVGATRTGSGGIVGASTSVITAQDIESSPAQTLPDILQQQTGIQVQHLYSGTNGSFDMVDLRGFGAFGQSNTLILVNGRRYQDFDLQGFDFSAIPLNSIERIEITRGNSGAVLYGDGAVGGVINIVTKVKSAAPFSGKVEGLVGSYNYKEGRLSVSGASGPWSASLYSNAVGSSGYRTNSDLREENYVGNLNYTTLGWSGYLNVIGNQQRQDFPGGVLNASTSFPFTLADPRETNTPFDFGNQQAINITTGFTATIAPGADLIIDGGVRRKFQQSTFYNYFLNVFPYTYDASAAVPSSYINTGLTTTSFTPRFDIKTQAFGVQNRLLTGFDFYNTQYDSDRYEAPGDQAIHHYNIRQTTLALYAMNTASVLSNVDISFGGRVQNNMVSALDTYNASADPLNGTGSYGTYPQAPPFDSSEWQWAAHLGYEYRINPVFGLFGRVARAFRLPNADERVGAGNPFGLTAPANFDLKTQTSYDVEQGFRVNAGRFSFESSVYLMNLNDEIHFIPALGQDVNLDPTRRVGWETNVGYQVSNDVRLRGGLAYTQATFREGQYAGNEIPLVSPWSGNVGLSWNIIEKLLVFDVTGRFWSARRMDNDQANVQPEIPGNGTVDVKIGGTYDRFFWSAAVENLFNVDYFDYAIASSGFPAGTFGPATPPTIGAYSAYPQAGRTFLLRAGATF